MSVRRRKDSGSWLVHIAIANRPEFRRTVSGRLTRRQAEELERGWRVDIEAGRDPRRLHDARRPDAITTWGELRSVWWDQHGQHLASSDRAEDHLDRISMCLGDDKSLASITTSDFSAAVARWRVEIPILISSKGKRRKLNPNNPTTINTRLRIAAAIMRYGREDLAGRCVVVPDIPWRRLKLEEPGRDPLSLHISPEVRTAVAGAASSHVRLAIRLAEETGLRVSSVLSLDWSRLDRKAGLGSVQVKSRKPGGRTLVIPLTAPLIDVLDETAGGEEWPGAGPVVKFRGKRVASIKKGVRSARAKAGAPRFVMKNVRHSTAIEIIAATGSIDAAGKALGHGDSGVTKKHYGDLDVAAVRRALEQRAKHIGSTPTAQDDAAASEEPQQLLPSKRIGTGYS